MNSFDEKGGIRAANKKAVNDRLCNKKSETRDSTLVERGELALRLTGIELTRTADLLIRI